MMRNLTPEQLAEGRRLLAEFRQSYKTCRDGDISLTFLRAQDAWHGWLHENGPRLLAPQISAAEFARKLIEQFRTESGEWRDLAITGCQSDASKRNARACERLSAIADIQMLAAQHNIDLGEQS